MILEIIPIHMEILENELKYKLKNMMPSNLNILCQLLSTIVKILFKLYLNTYTYLYICICTYMYMCIYIHINIHAHRITGILCMYIKTKETYLESLLYSRNGGFN